MTDRARDDTGRFAPAATPKEPMPSMPAVAPQATIETAGPRPVARPAVDDSALRELFNTGLKDEAMRAGKEPQLLEIKPKVVAEPTAEPEEAKDTGVPAKATDTGALEQALKALRLDGYTSEMLGKLSADEQISLGKAATRRQTEISKRFDESATKLKAAEEAAATKAKERAGTDEPPARQPDTPRPAVKLAAAKLGLGAEDEPALAALQDEATAEVRAELGQAKVLIGHMANILFELQSSAARGRLPESIRQHVDDAAFNEKVTPKARAWMQVGAYEKLDEAIHDAAILHVQPLLEERAAAASAKKSALRENGAMSTLDRRAPIKPKSRDDILRAAFDAIEKGATGEDQVRAAMNGS